MNNLKDATFYDLIVWIMDNPDKKLKVVFNKKMDELECDTEPGYMGHVHEIEKTGASKDFFENGKFILKKEDINIDEDMIRLKFDFSQYMALNAVLGTSNYYDSQHDALFKWHAVSDKTYEDHMYFMLNDKIEGYFSILEIEPKLTPEQNVSNIRQNIDNWFKKIDDSFGI